MEILLNDDWRLVTADALQFALQERRDTEKGRENDLWDTVGYHATVDSALIEMARRRIRMINVKVDHSALPKLCHALDEIKADISDVLDRVAPRRLTPITVRELFEL